MKHLLLTLPLVAAMTFTATSADRQLTFGQWMLTVHEAEGDADLTYQGVNRLNKAMATATYNVVGDTTSRVIGAHVSGEPVVSQTEISDCFGPGNCVSLAFDDGTAVLTQRYNFYTDVPYVVVDATLRGHNDTAVESRKIIPLTTTSSSYPLYGSSSPREIFVPFDNDSHTLGYESLPFGNRQSMTSSEVTCLFDADTRKGVVIGSVDHDKWKSGITVGTRAGGRMTSLECRSGFTDPTLTHELAEHHGKVKGSEIASARYMVGCFDDWREGLDTFGDACCRVVPRWEWDGGNPVGWNSWGNTRFNVDYAGVVGTAKFIKEQLETLGFYGRDGRVIISLDSGGEGSCDPYKLGNKVLGAGTYKDGRNTCQGLDMDLGLYGGLAIWEWNLDSNIPGTGLNGTPDYKWRDVALKVDGKIFSPNAGVDDYAMDCTHPAVRAHLEYTFKKWASYNCKYVKLDFLNCAIVDGDSYYDPSVTTGVQNYCYGMGMVRELAEKYDMYVSLSIAPLFPYQFGHGRRVCCDRESRLEESEYAMNAVSYGWWTDRLYCVNDPDLLVLHRMGANMGESMGENRVRATTGMTTGAFLLGDNFSEDMKMSQNDDYHRAAGDTVGYPNASRQRALAIFSNRDITDYVRQNMGSFRPVSGSNPSSKRHSERLFMRDTPQYLYVAVFNWSEYIPYSGTVKFNRLGIDSANVGAIKELWTGDTVAPNDEGIPFSVPTGDARVYRISKLDYDPDAAIHTVQADASATDDDGCCAYIADGALVITAQEPVEGANLYASDGRRVFSATDLRETKRVQLPPLCSGVYVIVLALASGVSVSTKGLVK